MLLRDLIRALREHFIAVDQLKAIPDKKQEATLELLQKYRIDKKIIEYFESMPLWRVRGIGPSKAVELWRLGVRPSNLKSNKKLLPEVTQMAIQYNVLERIPHADVERLANLFMPTKTNWTIVGSYRRNRPTSGDIDILYYGRDMKKLLEKLADAHGDDWRVFSQGPAKIAGIYTHGGVSVEVDLWIATRENKHAMMLYATGSKQHNILMRALAKRHDMLLNQNGLFDAKTNRQIPTASERDIFAALKMRYRPPTNRE